MSLFSEISLSLFVEKIKTLQRVYSPSLMDELLSDKEEVMMTINNKDTHPTTLNEIRKHITLTVIEDNRKKENIFARLYVADVF